MAIVRSICILYLVCVLSACLSSDESTQSDINSTDKEKLNEKVISNLDVDPSVHDFNGDGIQDATRTLTTAHDGGRKVIHIYMKVDDGYVSTYDGFDNEMVYPGDSIIQVSEKRFTFMYENGDHFTFEFIKDQGKWIAWQIQ